MKPQDQYRSPGWDNGRDDYNRDNANYSNNRYPNHHTSYSGFDADKQYMRNLNSNQNHFSNQYDEPGNYRDNGYDDRGYYEHNNRMNAPRGEWEREYYNMNYNNNKNRNYRPSENNRSVDHNWQNTPRNNETPWAFDRFAQKMENTFNRWVNRDYRDHTPDSDFS